LVLTIVVTIVLGHGRRVDLQAEQMAIYEENDGGKLPLTWAQTRRMPITHLVRPDV
jgi:(+)-abscisic acid 8'-hydroxylase